MKTLASVLFVFSLSVNAASQCERAIVKKHSSVIVQSCFAIKPEKSHMSFQEAILYNGLNHDFGTFDSPSPLFKKFLAIAENSSSDIKLALADSISLAFTHNQDEWLEKKPEAQAMSKHDQYAKYTELHESAKALQNAWYMRAANEGNTDAMARFIKLNVHSEIGVTNDSVRLKALEYALHLIEIGHREGDALHQEVLQTQSTSEAHSTFFNKLANYKQLSTNEVMDLAYSVSWGSYRIPNTLTGMLKVPENRELGQTMLLYLVDKRENAEAAYKLATLVQEQNKAKALAFFKQSAESGYPQAMGWYGDYLACIGKKEESLVWLDNALKKGHFYAEDSLEEIKLYGTPSNCSEGWIY